MMNNLYGNFVWWQGVVEDRSDPLKLGRCRVRIVGYHTDTKNNSFNSIPTIDLPWATPTQPITSAAMNGIGTTPLGPVEGTWVFGFFRDGENAQEPVMMGTIGGIPEDKPDTTLGFNDPSGVYPQQETKTTAPWGSELNEPDTNRLAVNDTSKEHPVIEAKKTARTNNGVDIPIANVTTKWSEPEVPYSAIYPKNHVRQSESGHIEEWDDTTDKERLHKYHKAGTFEEIHPDGTTVHKIVGDNYTIKAKDDNVHIVGNCNITIDANANWYVKGNVEQQIDGNWNIICNGTKTENVKKAVTEIYENTKNETVSQTVTENYQSAKNETVGGSLKNKIGGTTHKEYVGAFYERWDGDKHTHTGGNTFSRHESGTDHGCPSDPNRNSSVSCTDIQKSGL